MCYEKLSGSGPDSGWVSMTAKGIELLQPYEGEVQLTRDPAAFTKQKALLLQRELLAKYTTDYFQSRLQQMVEKYGHKSALFLKERRQLVFSMQKDVIPGYGFQPTEDGVQRMILAVNKFSGDNEISSNTKVINKFLRGE